MTRLPTFDYNAYYRKNQSKQTALKRRIRELQRKRLTEKFGGVVKKGKGAL